MTIVDAPPTVDTPWPVALLSTKIKGWIDRLGSVWTEGEITQWGVSGGNVYGKLKDLTADATVGFTIWSSVRGRLPDDLRQGDHVVALVKPNYWVKGGTLTMQVFEMRHVGLGDLLERLERLRKKLAAEGLFDLARKKPIPFLPGCIGLVTGKDSDAEKDVLRNAQLRWPAVKFRIDYAAVQGDRAAGEVTAALQRLDADPEVDVIVVARGGGDFQNLMVFSDETLVRAAAACRTPIISAIGHEADRPLLDDVADLRASTPTDAAKRVVPDVAEELQPGSAGAGPPGHESHQAHRLRDRQTRTVALPTRARLLGLAGGFEGGRAVALRGARRGADGPAGRDVGGPRGRFARAAAGAVAAAHPRPRLRHRPAGAMALSCGTPRMPRPAHRLMLTLARGALAATVDRDQAGQSPAR